MSRWQPTGLAIRSRDGRAWVQSRDNTYTTYARAVMEGHLRRALSPGEVVHHENEDPTDDRIENLRLFPSQAEHQRHHLWIRSMLPVGNCIACGCSRDARTRGCRNCAARHHIREKRGTLVAAPASRPYRRRQQERQAA